MKDYKRPLVWGIAYIGTIIVFAIVYWLTPSKDWAGERMEGMLDSLYFSVVTITSLGFGDTYPAVGSASRILVMTESVLGILFIGFFLNDIAMTQSRLFDKVNKEKEEEKRRQEAVEKLGRYDRVLTPVFERYLRGIFEVVTPINVRTKNFPKNILVDDFDFEIRGMCDMYLGSTLITNDFHEPAISVHYKNEDDLYDEIRAFATSANLSYWPELENQVYSFIANHHQTIQFKNAILGAITKYLGEEKRSFTVYMAEQIKQHDGNLKFREGNLMTPYEVLFVSLKENAEIVRRISRLMKDGAILCTTYRTRYSSNDQSFSMKMK